MVNSPDSPLGTDEVASELRIVVGRLVRRLRQLHEEGDLTLSELSVLARLDQSGPLPARLLAEQERVTGIGKMHPCYQRIGRDCQLLPSGKRQQGAVVADPQGNAFAALRTGRSGEVGADQLKLTH